MLSFDTNVLVYAADKRAGNKHSLACDLLSASSRLDVALTEQSLIEFLHAATRKARQPIQEVVQFIHAWLAVFRLLVPTGAVVTDTLHLLARYNLSPRDGRLLAVCAAGGCHVLFSEDLQDGAIYEGVHVLNPFNPANADRVSELLQQ
jgi:predicted nucleic acid-binding protein